MRKGLPLTDDSPAERAEDLPEARLHRIDRQPPGALVSSVQLLALRKSSHRKLAAKTPGRHAQPAEVLERISNMHQLPIEHCDQTVAVDQEIAEPKVPVHQRKRPLRRDALLEPAKHHLEGGHGLTEAAVERLG